MLDFYEQMIGPYPFRSEKMGVVETPHLGMEHQTMNAYGNEYKKDVYGYDWLLQHELRTSGSATS
jgi:aminopeptidase N